MDNKRSVVFIVPSLGPGGMERVVSHLTSNLSLLHNLRVYLLVLTKSKLFYNLGDRVNLIRPSFDYKRSSRVVGTLKTWFFLRSQLRKINPDGAVSFGGKYNSFVISATIGIQCKIFVSDRSKPSISYGRVLDLLNPIFYRFADGLIAQTQTAKEIAYRRTKHKNIKVIPNPIDKKPNVSISNRKKIILNVGRFIGSKNQKLLVDYFIKINNKEWELRFLGEGPLFEEVQGYASANNQEHRITFYRNRTDINQFYEEASIFAFTSVSEGFPNALGEAMAAGCACISFDCEAGPSDLIESGEDGILIEIGKDNDFITKLEMLMNNQDVRIEMGQKARIKTIAFDITRISEGYLNFILNNS